MLNFLLNNKNHTLNMKIINYYNKYVLKLQNVLIYKFT